MNKLYKFCIVSAALGLSLPLRADLGYANLVVTGTIVAESCSVAITSQSQNITIGNFNVNEFDAVGDVSQAAQLKIQLTGCNHTLSDTKIIFSGTPDRNNSELLALQDVSGTEEMATGVAIQLLDKNMQQLALNTPVNTGILQAEDNDLLYYLRYKATTVPVKAGNASSVLYFDMVYQ